MSIAKTTRPYLLTREAAAARIEALEKVEDVLERNARVQGKLLADTGRRVEALEAALTLVLPLVEAAAAFDREPWTGEAQRLVDQIRSALAPEQNK